MKKRLDESLVDQGIYSSRSQAKRAIQAGEVRVNAKVVTKAGYLVSDSDELTTISTDRYVGRGALKLKAAKEAFEIDFSNKIMVDVGASTGGFTDFALQQGAKKVYAIDVGHDQLADTLKNDPRVINKEGVNIREGVSLPELGDLVVSDLSFISLRLCLPEMFKLLKKKGQMICLFKPQFEGGRAALNKQGIVRLEKDRLKILETFLSWAKDKEYLCERWIKSPVVGQKGNHEYLLLFKKD